MTPLTYRSAMQHAQERVDAVDARVLLSHVTKRDAAHLIANGEAPMAPGAAETFIDLVDRRVAGEPVAYLVGEREFYGRSFRVSPAVLIPRPETEMLVDLALARIPDRAPARVLDLGTGSGCIALSIASERSQAKIVAADQSSEALAVARRNALALHLGNIAFVQSDWFSGLRAEQFDLVVSNPPYIAEGDPHLSQGDLRFEPREALVSGADGLDAIRAIVSGASAFLATGGWLLLEHGYDHGEKVREIMRSAGFSEIGSAQDLAGVVRVTGGRLTGSGPAQ